MDIVSDFFEKYNDAAFLLASIVALCILIFTIFLIVIFSFAFIRGKKITIWPPTIGTEESKNDKPEEANDKLRLLLLKNDVISQIVNMGNLVTGNDLDKVNNEIKRMEQELWGIKLEIEALNTKLIYPDKKLIENIQEIMGGNHD